MQVGTDKDWASAVAESLQAAAIKTDGSLWMLGNGEWIRLADGTWGWQYFPERFEAATDWVSISAGTNHTMAMRADGSVWVWGVNDYGQFGDGTICDTPELRTMSESGEGQVRANRYAPAQIFP